MNDLSASLFVVMFLGIFNVVGGLAVGSGLRQLITARMPQSLFLVVWGAFFGGVPLVILAALMLTSDHALLAAAGPLLFGSAIIFALLLLPRWLHDFGAGTLVVLIVGVVIMLVGAGVSASLTFNGRLALGLTIGGPLALLGGVLVALVVNNLLRTRQGV